MDELRARLRLTGAVASDQSLKDVLISVLGAADALYEEPASAGTGWHCERPVSPDEPIGDVTEVVVVSGKHGTLEIVPGSQGAPIPPLEGHGFVRTFAIEPGTTFVFDARLWYRFDDAIEVMVSVWRRTPARRVIV